MIFAEEDNKKIIRIYLEDVKKLVQEKHPEVKIEKVEFFWSAFGYEWDVAGIKAILEEPTKEPIKVVLLDKPEKTVDQTKIASILGATESVRVSDKPMDLIDTLEMGKKLFSKNSEKSS